MHYCSTLGLVYYKEREQQTLDVGEQEKDFKPTKRNIIPTEGLDNSSIWTSAAKTQ